MIFTAVAIALLPLVAHAQVVSPFGVIAIHSGSPIHLQALAATNNVFYVGGTTTSSCPLTSGCPPGIDTAFNTDSTSGLLFLDVEVPGNQQVYIQSNGALGFTPAHADEIPTGANATGFSYNPGTNFGDLGVPGGFAACSTSLGYQVFAGVPGANLTGCIGFDALTVNYTGGGPAAWQYD